MAPRMPRHRRPEGQQRLARRAPRARRAAAWPRAHSAAPACPARRACPARPGPARPAGPAHARCSRARALPSRRITGSSPVTSTTVDSSPIGAGPPSRMMATLAPRSACHVRGDRRAHVAGAVGAGRRDRADRRRAAAPGRSGCAGTLSAMVSRPAVARSATGQPGCLAITRVSGPGQNAAANCRPASVRRPSRAAASVSGTCTISGLKPRPALGGKDRRHRAAVAGVGAQAVHGLGGKGDEGAAAQGRAGGRDRLACCLQDGRGLLHWRHRQACPPAPAALPHRAIATRALTTIPTI